MLLIQEKFIHLHILTSHFSCQTAICKGSCCTEGDYGAPLEKQEIEQIKSIIPKLLSILSEEERYFIRENNFWYWEKENKNLAVSLKPDGSCIFLVKDGGIAKCGFELMYLKGEINFKKPISCHLYPIRVSKKAEDIFETLEYDRWDICKSACSKKFKPLIQFCKEAICRKYGESFYEQLEQARIDLSNSF